MPLSRCGHALAVRAISWWPMPIRTKRWNEPPEPGDGYRLLICRYRPRGIPREGEPWDAWCNALAPSAELHSAAYGKSGAEPLRWPEYTRRFLDEMSRQRYWIESFASRVRAGETMTLLCSSACLDADRCHRTLVATLLEDAAFPAATPTRSTGAVAPRIIRRRPT